jgi:hypothetical protein
MIPLQPPRYEVLNARPTLGESIKEFTIFEKLTVPALTAASAAGGFAFGESAPCLGCDPPPIRLHARG